MLNIALNTGNSCHVLKQGIPVTTMKMYKHLIQYKGLASEVLQVTKMSPELSIIKMDKYQLFFPHLEIFMYSKPCLK